MKSIFIFSLFILLAFSGLRAQVAGTTRGRPDTAQVNRFNAQAMQMRSNTPEQSAALFRDKPQ